MSEEKDRQERINELLEKGIKPGEAEL